MDINSKSSEKAMLIYRFDCMLAASFFFSLIPPSHHQIPGIAVQYIQSGVDLVCDVFFLLGGRIDLQELLRAFCRMISYATLDFCNRLGEVW